MPTAHPPLRKPLPPRRWPGPAGPARPVVLGTVLSAAVIGAVSIPLGRPGVGWLISVLAGSVALGAATWPYRSTDATGAPEETGPPETTSPPNAVPIGDTAQTSDATPPPAGGVDRPGQPHRPIRAWLARIGGSRLAWTAATVALVGVGAVRAAGWLFVLCLLTAGVTACLAVVDGRSTRGLLLSMLIPPAAVFRALPWAATGLSRIRRHPTTGEAGGSHLGRGLATVAVSVGLLVVFGALFASADAAFAGLLGDLLPEVSATSAARWTFLFVAIGGGLLGAAFVLARPPDLTGLDGSPHRRVRRGEWAVPLALLDALFALFVLVQVTVLFGGTNHVLHTSGLTYAEYARGGFWQLLVVSGLTLLVLAGAARWAPGAHRTDRLLIRLLLGVLALLSLVVVASALYRMSVYTEAYGASRLRLLVTVCELWIGLLFGLVLIAGVRLRAAWLPRLALASAVLALLGMVAANPDRLIADRNIERYQETGRVDIGYLSHLSADAVPALNRLPAALRACALRDIAKQLTATDDDWREANLGRAAARRLLADNPTTMPTYEECESQPSWR